jgi:hypothetical protein
MFGSVIFIEEQIASRLRTLLRHPTGLQPMAPGSMLQPELLHQVQGLLAHWQPPEPVHWHYDLPSTLLDGLVAQMYSPVVLESTRLPGQHSTIDLEDPSFCKVCHDSKRRSIQVVLSLPRFRVLVLLFLLTDQNSAPFLPVWLQCRHHPRVPPRQLSLQFPVVLAENSIRPARQL